MKVTLTQVLQYYMTVDLVIKAQTIKWLMGRDHVC